MGIINGYNVTAEKNISKYKVEKPRSRIQNVCSPVQMKWYSLWFWIAWHSSFEVYTKLDVVCEYVDIQTHTDTDGIWKLWME